MSFGRGYIKTNFTAISCSLIKHSRHKRLLPRSSLYHLSNASSAAIPGPSAIITPQSPDRGSPPRTISCRTNLTVGEDMFSVVPQNGSGIAQLSIGHSEMFLHAIDYLASTRMDGPEANLRPGKTMSLEQLLKRFLNHWAC